MAECVMAALSDADRDTDSISVAAQRAAGGQILAEAIHDLHMLRRVIVAFLSQE